VSLGALLYAAFAWLFLGGVIIQVFLAGMALFGLSDWTNHGSLGWTLPLLALFLPLLGFVTGVRGRTLGLAILLTVAAVMQPELALARHENPVVAALHPVNAMLVFWLAFVVARASLRELRRTDSRAPAPAREPSPSQEPSTSPGTMG
jgi:uncharacterized protein DUF6220